MAAKGSVVYRGAYPGEGNNLGWELRPEGSLPGTEAAGHGGLAKPSGQAGSMVQLTLTGTSFPTRGNHFSQWFRCGSKLSASRNVATLKITAGAHDVTVRTPSGNSNAAAFRVKQ